MGEQRKKINVFRQSALRVLVLSVCLMLTTGIGLANLGKSVVHEIYASGGVGDVCYWGINDSQYGVFMQNFATAPGNKTYAISSQGQMAYLTYELRTGSFNYSNCTFVLSNDIDLEKIKNNSKSGLYGPEVFDYPRWIPIDVGTNSNIVFDGGDYDYKG
ncbi:MAG: hypothetical protein J5598_02755, partial [Clostridia bacterium]|nr:hypothetical protein [Clostridia bacterium]